MPKKTPGLSKRGAELGPPVAVCVPCAAAYEYELLPVAIPVRAPNEPCFRCGAPTVNRTPALRATLGHKSAKQVEATYGRVGRPTRAEAASRERVVFLATADELARLNEQAQAAGVDRSAWIRRKLGLE